MTEVVFYLKSFFVVVGGIFVGLVGGYDALFSLWGFLVVMDIVTGFVKYTYLRELDSSNMWKGLIKKFTSLIVIMVAVKLESVFGNHMAIREIVIMFFVANEFLSIIENVGNFIELPEQFTKYFNQIEDNKKEDNEQ